MDQPTSLTIFKMKSQTLSLVVTYPKPRLGLCNVAFNLCSLLTMVDGP